MKFVRSVKDPPFVQTRSSQDTRRLGYWRCVSTIIIGINQREILGLASNKDDFRESDTHVGTSQTIDHVIGQSMCCNPGGRIISTVRDDGTTLRSQSTFQTPAVASFQKKH